jgi:hypothetical protein
MSLPGNDPDFAKAEELALNLIRFMKKEHKELSVNVRFGAVFLALQYILSESADTEAQLLFEECLDRFRDELNRLRSGERKRFRPN